MDGEKSLRTRLKDHVGYLWSIELLVTMATVCVQEPINPGEKRALNFLVHEYLIQHDNKLTSITFSEENADQVEQGGWYWGRGCWYWICIQ